MKLRGHCAAERESEAMARRRRKGWGERDIGIDGGLEFWVSWRWRGEGEGDFGGKTTIDK